MTEIVGALEIIGLTLAAMGHVIQWTTESEYAFSIGTQFAILGLIIVSVSQVIQ